MPLFVYGEFTAHSGERLPWKIDCDALTEDDLWALAQIIADRVGRFGRVEGVPTGGLRLAAFLRRHKASDGPLLIVDDVLTTGASMEQQRAGREAVGAVIFARGTCPSWVSPLLVAPPGGPQEKP
jgi:orotate phosphoribosyltransferase